MASDLCHLHRIVSLINIIGEKKNFEEEMVLHIIIT